VVQWTVRLPAKDFVMHPSRPVPVAIVTGLAVLGLLVSATTAAGRPVAGADVPATAVEAVPSISAMPVAAAAGDEIAFVGHGWGHGRGMGQYGALGYAVDFGWTSEQILQHFYSNTTPGGIANPEISVALMAHEGASQVVVRATNGLVIAGTSLGSTAAVVRLNGDGSLAVKAAAGCGGPELTAVWTFPAGSRITAASVGGYDTLVRVCESSSERGYRGALTVQKHAANGTFTVFNRLPIEDYLRGVVPRESPSSWGTLGSGRGFQALKAQSVAARSYAWSGTHSSGAKTCDTTSCQVYGGAYYVPAGPPPTVLEAALTDQAVAATAGQVRMLGTAVARTEFSSSTGGYTVAGTFPAVVDQGDAISNNPNHDWSATFTTAQVAAKLGISGVRNITVTGRNGLGDWGGRVTQVVVVDGAGTSHTYTGAQFRTKMGTSTFKSDWFTVAWMSPATAESLVRALYQDLLGRGPDPTGLAGWSAALVAGTPQATLVDTLTRSDEYISLRVRKAYLEVLGRGPDPTGARDWLVAIRNRQATVDDVQRRFYDSQEYFLKSGGTAAGYVRLLYTTVLRRGASDAEVASWVQLMGARGRGWVVDQIWFSMEAARVRAGDYYQTFLGRGPDPAGLTAWAQVLLTHGEGSVRNGIAGSMEYRLRAITRYP
jgi:SpoIID/LytB domain protein